jgi:hypothetical protein
MWKGAIKNAEINTGFKGLSGEFTMNNKTLVVQMNKLGVIYNREITKSLLVAYEEFLSELNDTEFTEAVSKWILSGKWFPKPSEILDMIQSQPEAASEAWSEVMKQLRDSQNAVLTPAQERAVNLIGGIDALSRSSYRELEFKKKDFVANFTPEDRIKSIKERLEHSPHVAAVGKLLESTKNA